MYAHHGSRLAIFQSNLRSTVKHVFTGQLATANEMPLFSTAVFIFTERFTLSLPFTLRLRNPVFLAQRYQPPLHRVAALWPTGNIRNQVVSKQPALRISHRVPWRNKRFSLGCYAVFTLDYFINGRFIQLQRSTLFNSMHMQHVRTCTRLFSRRWATTSSNCEINNV